MVSLAPALLDPPEQCLAPAASGCQRASFTGTVPAPLGAFKLTMQNIIQPTTIIHYPQCTLPPSWAIGCRVQLLHYMLT